MTRLGFTGTSRGMTPAQLDLLRLRFSEGDIVEFHHGDCVGADAQADRIARDYGVPVVVHPPLDPKARAFCSQPGDTTWLPKPYLHRNRDIVDFTDALVAAPASGEVLRSGTWSTVRHARRRGRPVTILPRETTP